MQSRVISGLVGLTVLGIFLVLTISLITLAATNTDRDLTVTFLDVGQGDATLIETPAGVQVLIDGGRARSANRPLSRELPFYDRSLDMVLATHADSDHIGGLVDTLREYQVGRVAVPTQPSDTPVYDAFQQEVEKEVGEEGAVVDELTRGDMIDLGDGAYLLTLFPLAGHAPTDSNESSLIMKLIYGDTSVILTGDSPQIIEEYLAALDGELLDADILKVGHHGSDTSSADVFISAVSPAFGVVSAGADNSYGHPTPGVMSRLVAQSVETSCTCEEGSISFQSNGEEFVRLD